VSPAYKPTTSCHEASGRRSACGELTRRGGGNYLAETHARHPNLLGLTNDGQIIGPGPMELSTFVRLSSTTNANDTGYGHVQHSVAIKPGGMGLNPTVTNLNRS
jgi:hypothetical protein